MLQLIDIKKDYLAGDQVVPALKGITLDFRKNEFVSILGPSGCGKTTLMNIIGGLDNATSGDLIANGKSTKQFKDKDWDNYRNKRIGFVFQSYNLIPHLTVLGNVELALTISGMSAEQRRKKASDALARVGLTDHLVKKPNQLSGGQMQRVAIARALVNSPDILLADEPTGALDTETSEQIMELIREISGEKLVIMVTHNPELAKKYSTRHIKMLDGKIISDSDPYDSLKDLAFRNEVEKLRAIEALEKNKKKTKVKKERSAMSFFTALSLSFRNLVTKKGRTVLTSIAGSIGIVGIALILAMSNGMNAYVAKMTADTLSSSPLTVASQSFDMTQAMHAFGDADKWEKFPDSDKVIVEKSLSMADMIRTNNITKEYVDYLDKNLDPAWYNDCVKLTGMQLGFYAKQKDVYYQVPKQTSMTGQKTSMFQYLMKSEFLSTQYDKIKGNFPENKNEAVLVVNEYNMISDTMLTALGLRAVGDESTEIDFDKIIGSEFKVLTNDQLYEYNGTKFTARSSAEVDFNEALSVKIVGILRVNSQTELGVLSRGVGYTKELYDWLSTENQKSEIVTWMNQSENVLKDPATGMEYNVAEAANNKRETDFRSYGGATLPNEISIYAKDFDGKAAIKGVLDKWNDEHSEKEDKIVYSDMSEMFSAMINNMVNIISYVLIGFTSISLVVSCVMIGIITYVSVIERTKEIGILRSIGARKKDITRVFNAETVIIGFFAGLIGVVFAGLLTIPINLIIQSLTDVVGIASLNVLHAVLLVAISVLLTLVSGLIPAKKASKKDPVLALRTE